MRLFSAILVPEQHLAELAEIIEGPRERHPEFRWAPAGNWHITLGYYGGVEPAGVDSRLSWLRERLDGQPAPKLRLAGAGTFPQVLWAGVESDGLAGLARLAGAETDGRAYHAHLTLARHTPEQTGAAQAVAAGLAGYRSPEWTAAETVLMTSERIENQQVYRVAGRIALRTGW